VKFTYPFYGRIFDIFSAIKTLPWFKGNEVIAARANAEYLIILHQLLLLKYLTDLCVEVFGINGEIINPLYIAAAVFAFVFNWLVFSKWHRPTSRDGWKDAIYIGVFVMTAGVSIYGILFGASSRL
jgi:hypothetical protein